MVFLRIHPGSRSSRGPSCAWNNCIIPSKNVKNIKTRRVCGIFLFYTSRLQTSEMEQTFLNTSIFPRCIESRCTEKNQARSLMTSTHASVRCSILVFTDIQPISRSITLPHRGFLTPLSGYDPCTPGSGFSETSNRGALRGILLPNRTTTRPLPLTWTMNTWNHDHF